MKFTIVFTTLMCVSTSWAVLAKTEDEPKEKREAPVGYGAPEFSAHSYQAPTTYSQGDASAISVGAGYSIGGGKPSYSFGGQGSSASLQIPSEGLSPNGHATLQLAPITLQPSHGAFASGDLSQLMSQLSQSLNSGAISFQPSNTVAEFHQSADGIQGLTQGLSQGLSHGFAQGQQLSLPQYTYGAPKFELSPQFSSAPAYSGNTKGLSSFTSTGPVLFTPSSAQSNAQAPSFTYNAASAGQSLGDAGSLSLGSAPGSGHSFGGAGQSFSGSAQSLGSATHSLDGVGSLAGLSLGGVGPSFGSYKPLSGGYSAPSKTSFKPSAFLGASVQGESGHGPSSFSGSYGAPSFGSFRGGSHGGLSLSSSAHGPSFGGSQGFGSGSSKFIAPSYQSYKTEGLEGASGLSSGHFSSSPVKSYGLPSYSNNIHSASSSKPYYVSSKHYRAAPGSFSHGSSAYRSPASSHSSLSAYSPGPKYSFGSSSSQYDPTDAHGSASETSYNTIKYSQELKPRVN